MRSLLLLLLVAAPLWADVTESPFGKLPSGEAVTAYTLANKNGMKAKVITYGAILTELQVPDKDGKTADVVLGYDKIDGYLKDVSYFGANVGRCANRIAHGRFILDGKEFTVATNAGKHHLHGGARGFDKKLWTATPVKMMIGLGSAMDFSYESPDGEEGYPGTLKVNVRYLLTEDNELKILMTAFTDKITLCNLAHHSYFNLAGHDSGDILKQVLTIPASKYTPTDETLIPNGKIEAVADTVYDFTKPTAIGARLKQIKSDPVGYDVNYNRTDGPGEGTVAIVLDPASGRRLTVVSNQRSVQFYSGNHLDGKLPGKGGAAYKQYAAFCLEPQIAPDAINKSDLSDWQSPILKPGQKYEQVTTLKFDNPR